MKQKTNIFRKLKWILGIFLILFISCQKDQLEDNCCESHNTISSSNDIVVKYIDNEHIPSSIQQKFDKVFAKQKGNTIDGYLQTSFGLVDLNNIMQVSTDNKENFTFSVYYEAQDSNPTVFYNLVIETNNEEFVEFYLRKYEMSDEFYAFYSSGEKTFSDFEGIYTKILIDQDFQVDDLFKNTPCPPNDIVNPPNPPNPPTGPIPNNPPPPNTGAGYYEVQCTTTTEVIECNGGLKHDGTNPSCSGTFQGATITIETCEWVFVQSKSTFGSGCDNQNNGPIGVLPNPLPLIVIQLQNILGYNFTQSQIDWIEKNNENMAFAQEVLNLMQNGAEIDFADTNFHIKDAVILDPEFTNNQKLYEVYTDMGKAPAFNNYLNNFNSEMRVANLRFGYDVYFGANHSEYTTAAAITIPPQNYLIQIIFNGDPALPDSRIDNQPKLIIALTFIHEMIHAEIFRKLMSVANLPHVNFENLPQQQWETFMISLMNHFPGIWDYYLRYEVQNPNPSPFQHQQMAQHYRSIIVSAISQYDNFQQPASVYEALAWIGLKNTVAWNNLSPAQQITINTIISNYYASNPD